MIRKLITKLSLINIKRKMSIVILVDDDNRSVSNAIFSEGSVIDNNIEFTNCEFKTGCIFKKTCKFSFCIFSNCEFVKGCEFIQCNFYFSF